MRTGECTYDDVRNAWQGSASVRDAEAITRRDPPCGHCNTRLMEHVNRQCLFGSTCFQQPSEDELYYYVIFGYFKGRHV